MKFGDMFVPCWQDSALCLYLNVIKVNMITDIRFRDTNRAFSLNSTYFSCHCLCFNCLHTVSAAAYEVGRTPEQPAPEHV